MKITITGSLGNIGNPLTRNLVEKGHKVIGIDNRTERDKSIIDLGATPAIGNLEDLNFLIESFDGADAVFTMYPPNNYLDQNLDLLEYYKRWSKNYAKAISEAKVKRVVNLSSIGAHLDKGNGIISGAFYVEKILNELLPEVSITHIRPASLYTNLYGYMDTIKSDEKIYASFGSTSIPWASPKDISQTAAEELVQLDADKNIRYVASEELTGDEIARILGIAIEKPNLKWQIISDEAVTNGFKAAGMNSEIATGLTEMYAALQSGLMAEDYVKNRPQKMGKAKLKDFAKEFAKVYQENH